MIDVVAAVIKKITIILLLKEIKINILHIIGNFQEEKLIIKKHLNMLLKEK